MYTVPGFPGSGATKIGTGTAGLTGPVPAVPAVLFLRQNVPSKFVKMDISDEELVKRLDHILHSELMTNSSLKLNMQWRGKGATATCISHQSTSNSTLFLKDYCNFHWYIIKHDPQL